VSVKATYSIGDLAAAAGVSRRTLHFYVQRGLLQPPAGRGRGARYTDAHLARLLQIKTWQEQGMPLQEIRERLEGRGPHPPRGPDEGERMYLERRSEEPEPDGRAALRRLEVPAGAATTGTAGAPGAAWFRQPLVAGFELHVAAGRRPLTAWQLALLARSLGEILENGGDEE
jgi:DNA-binding transcriptional MerR regulator